jgi:hypothetical protein
VALCDNSLLLLSTLQPNNQFDTAGLLGRPAA